MASTTNDQHGGQEPDVYKVIPSPGKGLGMFATRDIEQGERILEDGVLFIVPEGLSKEETIDCVTSAYGSLPPHRKGAFLGLHNPDPSNLALHLLNRYYANAFELSLLSEIYCPVMSYVVCLEASRINHSCAPNAYLDFNEFTYRATVHAIADIPAEHEITVSYCAPHYIREIRMGDLARYDFVCHCPVCQPTAIGQRLEAERRVMQDTWLSLYDRDGNENPYPNENLMERLFRMIKLLTEQGLNVAALSALYRRAANLHVNRGLRSVAIELAEDQVKAEMCRLGRDSPQTQDSMRYLSELNITPGFIVSIDV